MYDKKSVYAINKRNPSAIMYPDVTGEAVRLTAADFSSVREFEYWKQWSDQDYHAEDNANVRENRHTIPIDLVSEQILSVPGMEHGFLSTL